MSGLRRRAEFLVGAPLLLAQHLSQRVVDSLRDVSSAVRRERLNARFVGELTVRTLLRSPTSAPARPPTTVSRTVHSTIGAQSPADHAHLGVAELLAAIPAMAPDQRSALLAEERAGRNRTRVIDLLEQLGA